MKKILLYLWLPVLLGIPLISGAQETPKDFWVWNTISLDKKLNRNFSIIFEEELRLFDNASRINLFFSNIGVSYRYRKNFKFSLVYRFINKSRVDMPYSQRHRLYIDAAYKTKWNKFVLGYRLRLQGQVRDYQSSKLGPFPETYMRNKFDVEYNLGKFDPFVALEIRYQFNNPRFHYGDDHFDRTRSYIGVNYDIDRNNSFELYYMIQHDFNNQNLENDYTVGWQYSHSF